MSRYQKFQKYSSLVLLLIYTSSLLVGVFSFASQARALAILPVPISVEGGSMFGSADSGAVTTVKNDRTQWRKNIVQSATIAAMNTALREFSNQLNDALIGSLGITNDSYYVDALVEAKYVTDQFKKDLGNKYVAINTDTRFASGILGVAQRFETGMGVTGEAVSATDAARMAMLVNNSNSLTADQKQALYSQLLVGAMSEFMPSISCGGINAHALNNAAVYMATLNAGKRPIDINPNSQSFYQDMSRLGSPYADPNFLKLSFQDAAAGYDARARQAAMLEITSPGLKSPQKGTVKQLAAINKNLNLVVTTQNNGQGAIFQIAQKATDVTYDTSSFRAFIIDIVSQEISNWLMEKITHWLGANVIGVKVAADGTFEGKMAMAAQAAGIALGRVLITTFAIKMYDTVANMVWDGMLLGESSTCRQSPAISDLQYQKPKFTNTGFDVPGYGDASSGNWGGGGNGSLIFVVSPQSIKAGEQVTIVWDAGLLDPNQTGNLHLTLNGGSFNNKTEPVSGSETDTPQVTTTYTLTVTGVASQTASQTVTVGAGGGNYTLTVSKAGTGSGTVVSTPAGINCGGTCSASFATSTAVTLAVTPDTNSTFTGWSGGCSGTAATCSVTMSTNTTVTATFNASGGAPTITVTTNPASGIAATSATLNGTVTSSGSSVKVWFNYADGSGTHLLGSTPETTLTVTPNTAMNFTATVTGLTAATTYSFGAYASDPTTGGAPYNGVHGSQVNFTTSGVSGAFTSASPGLNVRQ